MFAEALRFEIEEHARCTRGENPLLLQAAAGIITPAAIGRYLTSVGHLIARTPMCLSRARACAHAAGRHALAEHFEHKHAEEHGHDEWARDDLRLFESLYPGVCGGEPVPAMAELCRYIEDVIERDPVLYLAYILWAEYFTVLTGAEFAGHLVERCGIPRDALTCLLRHVELDQHHTDEGLDVIDALVEDPSLLPPMREVLQNTMALFERACIQMAEAGSVVEHSNVAAV